MIDIDGIKVDEDFANGANKLRLHITTEQQLRTLLAAYVDPEGTQLSYRLPRSIWSKADEKPTVDFKTVKVFNPNNRVKRRARREVDIYDQRVMRSSGEYTEAELATIRPDAVVDDKGAHLLRIESGRVYRKLVKDSAGALTAGTAGDDPVTYTNMYTTVGNLRPWPVPDDKLEHPDWDFNDVGGRALQVDVDSPFLKSVYERVHVLQKLHRIFTGFVGAPPVDEELLAATAMLDLTKPVHGEVVNQQLLANHGGLEQAVHTLRLSLAKDLPRVAEVRTKLAEEVRRTIPLPCTVVPSRAGVHVAVLVDRRLTKDQFEWFTRAVFEHTAFADHVRVYNCSPKVLPMITRAMVVNSSCAELAKDHAMAASVDSSVLNYTQLMPVLWSIRDDGDGYTFVNRPTYVGRPVTLDELVELYGHPNHPLDVGTEVDDQTRRCQAFADRVQRYLTRTGLIDRKDALPVKLGACIDSEQICAKISSTTTPWVRTNSRRGKDAEYSVTRLDLDVAIDYGCASPVVRALHARDKVQLAKLINVRALGLRTFASYGDALRYISGLSFKQLLGISCRFKHVFSSPFYEDLHPSTAIYRETCTYKGTDNKQHTRVRERIRSFAPERGVSGDALDVLRCLFSVNNRAVTPHKAADVFCDLFDCTIVNREVRGVARCRRTPILRDGRAQRQRSRLTPRTNIDRILANLSTCALELAENAKCIRASLPVLALLQAKFREDALNPRVNRREHAVGLACMATADWLVANAERLIGRTIGKSTVERQLRLLTCVGLVDRAFTPKQVPNIVARMSFQTVAENGGEMPATYVLVDVNDPKRRKMIDRNLAAVIAKLGDSATPMRRVSEEMAVTKLGKRLAGRVYNLAKEPDEYARLYGKHAAKLYRLSYTVIEDEFGRRRLDYHVPDKLRLARLMLRKCVDVRADAEIRKVDAALRLATASRDLKAGNVCVHDVPWSNPDLIPWWFFKLAKRDKPPEDVYGDLYSATAG